MKSWEATDEEMKAASLGGLTPGVLDGRCMWIKQLSSSYFPVPNSLIMSSRF